MWSPCRAVPACTWAPRGRSTSTPPTRVDKLVADKGDQPARWAERGILAIVRDGDEVEDLLADLERRAGSQPWWRVYIVARGADSAERAAIASDR